MASREETLLFIVDVQVRNAQALRALDAELDAAASGWERRRLALSDPTATAGSGGVAGRPGAPAAAPPESASFAGARSSQRVGSRENPMIVAEESGKYAGLGALAAASGAQSADQGPQAVVAAGNGGDNGPTPVAPAAPAPEDKQWLEAAAQTIAQKTLAPENDRVVAAVNGAAALRRSLNGTPDQLSLFEGVPSTNGARQMSLFGIAPTSQRDTQARSALAPDSVVRLSAAQTAQRLGVSRGRVYEMAGGGQLAGAEKQGGSWSIPEQAVVDTLAAGGSGDRGGGVPRIARGTGGGGGGNDRNGLLRRLIWGNGLFGLAGAGSVASLAGLGPEHVLMTAAGIAGSGATALGGAGLLGAGSLGQLLVGGGSDLAAMGTTISNVKNLSKAYDQVDQAVATYGANSKQAKAAQQQLDSQLKQLSQDYGPAAANAMNQVALSVGNLGDKFDKALGPGIVQATKILQGAIGVANTFVPLIGQAASRNLSIVNQDLKPLFAWLEGPHGIGIFQNLENNFAHNLPFAVHAFDQAVELALRVMSLASNETGGLTRGLDHLFTRLNSMSDQQLNRDIERLIGDFRIWEGFVKALGSDLYLLFHQDAGTGQGIVVTLTQMLQKLGEWERSTQGRSQLHNIFEVHKGEVLALLHVLGLLAAPLGSIYMTLAPSLTKAFTGILDVVVALLNAIDSLGPAARDLLGLALLAGKLGVLGTAIRGIAAALGLVAARAPLAARGLAEVDLATGAGGVASSGAGAAAGGSLLSRLAPGAMGGALAARLGGAVGAGGLFGFSGAEIALMAAPVMAGLLAGGAGVLGGSLIQHATGLRGGTAATIGGGVGGGAIGAGIGTLLGGPLIGTAIGAGIGSTFGPTIGHLLGSLFGGHSGEDYGKKFAAGFVAPFSDLVPRQSEKALQGAVAKAADAYNSALHPSAAPGILPNAKVPLPNPRDVQSAASKLGTASARAFIAGFNTVPFKSEEALSSDMLSTLKGLPSKARQAAATTMVEYAKQLQQSGQLPAGSVKHLINNIEKQFPNLTVYLNNWAHLTSPRQNLEKAIGTIRADFGELNIDKNVNGRNLLSNLTTAMGDLRTLMHSKSQQVRQEATAQFKQLTGDVGKLLDGMRAKANSDMVAMAGSVTSHSAAAKVAGLHSFQLFAAGTAAYMGSGQTATEHAISRIEGAANQMLKQIGQKPLSPLQAQAVASASLLSGGAGATAGGLSFHATGGKVTRPMYMVGEEAPAHHEYVIASNPAYRHRNRKLWAQAGKDLGIPGFAQGGTTGGFVPDPGTNFTVGQEPQIAVDLGRLARALGVTIYGISGYRSPAHSVAVGGFANDPHTRGEAADIGVNSQLRSSAAQISEAVLAQFGLWRPFDPSDDPSNPEVNHVQLLGTGGAGGGGATGGAGAALPVMWKDIAAPHIKGGGLFAAGIQGLVNKLTKDVNAYGQKKAGTASGASGVSGAGIPPGSWMQVASALAKRHGWSPAEVQAWYGVEQREDSSLSLTATNPTSGAYGLAQFIQGPSQYAQYGGDSTTLVGQLTAMSNYIAQRYGTPSAAFAHEIANNWYAQGGVIGLPGYATGGVADEKTAGRSYAHAIWKMLGAEGALPHNAPFPGLQFPAHSPINYGGVAAPYGSLAPADHVGLPLDFLPHLFNSNDPLHPWAYKSVIHEMAHGMQTRAAQKQQWTREGGAAAWASEFSPFKVDDTKYDGFKARVLREKGLGWVKSGQFRHFAQGGLIPGFATGGIAYQVRASHESDGGTGAFGFSPGGMGYSSLSASGRSSDAGTAGAALGHPHPPNPLYIRHANKIITATLQDIGAGSDSFLPTIGLYPQAYAALGQASGQTVDIERKDGKAFTALRGTPIPAFGPLAGGASADQINKLKHSKKSRKAQQLANNLSWIKYLRAHGVNMYPFGGGPGSTSKDDVIGADGPFPFNISDLKGINALLGPILGLDGTAAGSGSLAGDAQKKSDLIDFYTNFWSSSLFPPSVPSASDTFGSWGDPSAFVITADKFGQSVPPYLSPHLPGVTSELGQVTGWQQQIVGDLQSGLGLSEKLRPKISAAIKRRVKEVARIRHRVEDNIKRIKQLQKQIADEKKKKPPSGLKGTALKAWQKARSDAISGWQKQITKLENENQQLVGGKDAIPSTPAGELGTIQGELGSAAGGSNIDQVIGTNSAASGLYDLGSIVDGWVSGLGGATGDIATQTIQLDQYKLGLSNLDPSGQALADALKAANLAGTPTAQNPLTGSTAFTYQGQSFLAGMAQGGMLGGIFSNMTSPFGAVALLPPFAGTYHQGGLIGGPGRVGDEVMVRAQVGESINAIGGGADGGMLAGELRSLRQAICAHDDTVRQLTMATKQNTQATASATSRGSVSFTGGGGLASDRVIDLGVGS